MEFPMPSSIRMEDDLLLRLKQYAETRVLSASAVVREALTRYLDQQQQTPHEIGQALFGRYSSAETGTSSRSVERKAVVRRRVRDKHDRR
jgi:predicted transcriptional regulator